MILFGQDPYGYGQACGVHNYIYHTTEWEKAKVFSIIHKARDGNNGKNWRNEGKSRKIVVFIENIQGKYFELDIF